MRFLHRQTKHFSLPVIASVGGCVFAIFAILATADAFAGDGDGDGEKPTPPKITFDDHIAALLRRRCSSCHNADRSEADLDVTNFIALMQGGGSGVVIEDGSADDSYLFRLVNHDDSPEMPPGGNKLPDAEILQLKRWIDGGALENEHSAGKKRKPKLDLTKIAANPNQRPTTAPLPPRLPREPVLWTTRKSPVRSIAINPWSPIAAIAAPKQIVIFNTKTLELVGVIPFAAGQPEILRFSRNGQILLIGGGVGGDSGNVAMWDVVKGDFIATIGQELDSVLACDISPDQSMVALGGPKKRVKVYSTADGSLLYEVTKHTDWITAIEFSPDGKNLASGDRNGGLIISDAPTGIENFSLIGHKSHITSLSFRIDGKTLASGGADKSVRVWEMNKGKQIKNWEADASGITEVYFIPSGELITAGRSKTVKAWQQDGTALRTFGGLTEMAMGLAFCDETKRVIAGSFNGEVRVWDFGNAEPIGELNSPPLPIAQRIANLRPQIRSATADWQTATLAVKSHQQQIQQIEAEIADAINRRQNARVRNRNAAKEAVQTTAALQATDDAIAALGDDVTKIDSYHNNDSAHKPVKALHKKRRRLQQQLTVLNNQQVAFDGTAGAVAQRIDHLQQETNQLNEQRIPLKADQKSYMEALNKLERSVEFWAAELRFAQSIKAASDTN